MSWSRLAIALRRWWPVVLAGAVVGALLGLGAATLATPTYTSSLKLYVSGVGTTASDRLQSGEYARSRVSSYADLIGSAEVMDAVRAYLGVPLTGASGPGQLATAVSASNPLDTSVIDVTVQAPSPEQARQVAVAIGAVTNTVVGRLESPPDGADSPVRLTVASPPTLPVSPDGPGRTVFGAGGLAVGALLGLALAAVLETGRSRRSRQRLVVQPSPTTPRQWAWWPGASDGADRSSSSRSSSSGSGPSGSSGSSGSSRTSEVA